MRTRDEIKRIVDDTWLWKTEDSHFIAHCLDLGDIHLTADELALVDPRLPHLIRALKPPTSNDVDGTLIDNTLVLWGRQQEVLAASTQKRVTVHKMFEVTFEKAANTMTIKGQTYELGEIKIRLDGAPVFLPYAMALVPLQVTVEITWMNQHYPGWQGRLSGLEALGYSGMDKARLFFQPELGTPTCTVEGLDLA